MGQLMSNKRKYLETHPWINFSVNLAKAGHQFWMLLGEIQSKCEHIAGTPLLPSIAREFYRVYLAKGVSGTTSIEGNTLSEEEVLQHLKGKLKLPPSKEYLKQEIDNVIEACNLISKEVLEKQNLKLNVEEIKFFNRLVLKNLELDEDVVPGEFREHGVVAGHYRGAPAEDCEYLTQKLVDWLNDFTAPGEDLKIAFGVLKAIIAHVYFVWIHPFGDGNGRTARLIEFKILLSVGVPDAAAHLLSNFYNQTRQKYYLRLDQASKKKDGIISFIEYALEGFRDELKEQLKEIRFYQWDTIWINYVHSVFKNKNKPTDIRRRHLILDLSEQKEAVPIKDVRYISRRITRAYEGKSEKTITRDINLLIKKGLIAREKDKIRARKEIILAFLPESVALRSILFGER